MSTELDETAQELAFQRLLLDSAQSDGPAPGATDRAWERFAASAAATAAITGAAPDATALLAAGRRAMLKWVSVGMLGGGALTALWLSRGAVPRPPVYGSPAALPAVASAAERRPAPAGSGTPQEPRAERVELHGKPGAQRLEAPKLVAKHHNKGVASTKSSVLAREIAAIDAIRAATRAHDSSTAVRLADEYLREFPNGQLAAEGHALAIEAVFLRGEREEARRRAAGFLARYPNDPQASRLRELVDRH